GGRRGARRSGRGPAAERPAARGWSRRRSPASISPVSVRGASKDPRAGRGMLDISKVNPKVIGYALNVVGLFFLASAISFKKPRRQIEEVLGVERPRSLFAVREQLVNQVQTYIGFVILVVGFVLLMSDALHIGSGGNGSGDGADPKLFWIVCILVLATVTTTGVLKLVQLLFVRSKFRRLVREVVRSS